MTVAPATIAEHFIAGLLAKRRSLETAHLEVAAGTKTDRVPLDGVKSLSRHRLRHQRRLDLVKVGKGFS